MKDGEYISLSKMLVIVTISVFLFLSFLIYKDNLYYFLHYKVIIGKSKGTGSFNNEASYTRRSRGLRNNNPLNLKYSKSTHWLGKVYNKKDPDFEEFVSVAYGFRAAYKVLVTYKKKYNINTIEEIVYRFSPPDENNTEGIINRLENMTGLRRRHKIISNDYPILLQKMALLESGGNYSIKFIKDSINLT